MRSLYGARMREELPRRGADIPTRDMGERSARNTHGHRGGVVFPARDAGYRFARSSPRIYAERCIVRAGGVFRAHGVPAQRGRCTRGIGACGSALARGGYIARVTRDGTARGAPAPCARRAHGREVLRWRLPLGYGLATFARFDRPVAPRSPWPPNPTPFRAFPLQRVYDLHTWINDGKRVTKAWLAAQGGVSRSTVKRDLTFMRTRLTRCLGRRFSLATYPFPAFSQFASYVLPSVSPLAAVVTASVPTHARTIELNAVGWIFGLANGAWQH